MRKIRRKWLSILLTLAMLVGLMVPFAGTAAADTTYGVYRGAFNYIDADTNQSAGYALVEAKDDTNNFAKDGAEYVFATVTLPSGVKYNKTADQNSVGEYVYINEDLAEATDFYGATSNSVTVKVSADTTTRIKFLFDRDKASTLDVASDFSGDVKATVEIIGWNETEKKIVWVESGVVTIAKVVAKDVSVTADDPEVIQVGSGKSGATITIQETRAGALAVGEAVYFQIETPDVKFSKEPKVTATSGMTFNPRLNGDSLSEPTRLLYFRVDTPSQVLPAKITVELDRVFDVPPSVTGDIKVTVYSKKSDGTKGKISDTTLTVARVGTVSVAITDVKNTGGTVYAGYKDPQTVKEGNNSAEFKLKATGGNIAGDKVVTVELSAGKFGSTPFAIKDKDGKSLNWNIKTYNDGKSAWFETSSGYSEIKLTDFSVVVDGDAKAGDLVVKIGGTAGASGEVVIGKIAKPFTVSATAPQIPYLGQGQAAGDIVITEAAAGTILRGQLVLELPEGITFDGMPSVKVTAGNIDAKRSDDTTSSKLVIDISGESGLASTITVSGIKYNVSRSALYGDVVVKVKGDGEKWDGKVIAEVANATIVSPTKRTAVFNIGSNVYTVNGVEYTMDVAPYIKDGRTMLPVRYVAYSLGVDPANVLWDNATATVTLLKGTTVVQMTIGSKVLKINGIGITLDVAPEVVSGRTMLPYRFVAQALGASVSWDAATQTVTMNID